MSLGPGEGAPGPTGASPGPEPPSARWPHVQACLAQPARAQHPRAAVAPAELAPAPRERPARAPGPEDRHVGDGAEGELPGQRGEAVEGQRGGGAAQDRPQVGSMGGGRCTSPGLPGPDPPLSWEGSGHGQATRPRGRPCRGTQAHAQQRLLPGARAQGRGHTACPEAHGLSPLLHRVELMAQSLGALREQERRIKCLESQASTRPSPGTALHTLTPTPESGSGQQGPSLRSPPTDELLHRGPVLRGRRAGPGRRPLE